MVGPERGKHANCYHKFYNIAVRTKKRVAVLSDVILRGFYCIIKKDILFGIRY